MHLTIVLNPCLSGLRRLRTSSAPSLHSSGLSGGGPAERQRLLYQKSRRVEDCEVCICVCVLCVYVCVLLAGSSSCLQTADICNTHRACQRREKKGFPTVEHWSRRMAFRRTSFAFKDAWCGPHMPPLACKWVPSDHVAVGLVGIGKDWIHLMHGKPTIMTAS